MKDNDLFLRFVQGSEEAFRTLVERYESRAYWVAYHIVQNDEDARDVVQEALVKIVRSAASFDPSQNFRTWLFRIVSNTAIDLWRKSRKATTVPLEGLEGLPGRSDSPSLGLSRSDLRSHIDAVILEIPPMYRQVLVLRDIEGLSSKDIGQDMGLSHSTARWRLHHARNMFQEIWNRKVGLPFEEIAPD